MYVTGDNMHFEKPRYVFFFPIIPIFCKGNASLCVEVNTERERERGLTVPATDFDDMNVLALNLDKPKSHT